MFLATFTQEIPLVPPSCLTITTRRSTFCSTVRLPLAVVDEFVGAAAGESSSDGLHRLHRMRAASSPMSSFMATATVAQEIRAMPPSSLMIEVRRMTVCSGLIGMVVGDCWSDEDDGYGWARVQWLVWFGVE